jgi:bis(5'-nucleosidyl)-tetraphosphatase
MAKTPTHAGGVTFRRSGDRTFYLVISSSDGGHWVLPKGHIEPGESPEATVLRELKEEAGVMGEIVDRLYMQRFEGPEEEAIVQYFLVRELASTEASEKRSLRWEDEQTALQLLTFEDSRAALRNAAAVARGWLEDRSGWRTANEDRRSSH